MERVKNLPNAVLLAVAAAYGLSQVAVYRATLAWDELVYFSQVSRATPAAFFSAPRARGISWLVEPVALATASPAAMRVYLTVLSALALYLAFRVWFGVLEPPAVICAAMAFASLWVVRFYGPEAMPNLWVAFGVITAVGGFLRVRADPTDKVGLVALPVGLAVAAVMRPSDAFWTTAPLLAFALLSGKLREHVRLILLTALGALVGAVPWIVEAYTRFGGVASRLQRASEIEGGLGWHPRKLLEHWRTLDGPLLCRPCQPAAVPPLDTFWLFLIPVAVVIAVLVLRRKARVDQIVVPVVVAASLSVPYLLLVNYSAPRFVLPALALATLPVGVALWWLVGVIMNRDRARYPLLALLVLLFGVHLVEQQRVVVRQVNGQVHITTQYANMAADLNRHGVVAPCVVSGTWAPAVGYYTGCSSRDIGGHDGSITESGLADLGRLYPVAVIGHKSFKAPAYGGPWTKQQLAGSPERGTWVAYVSHP